MDQDFWDKHHRTSNITWLSGNNLKSYLKFFQITENDIRGKTVLEIGVGLGRASRELAALAQRLLCADISEVALQRLEDQVEDRYSSKDLAQAPQADLVLCHLVSVHCNDQEVQRMLNDIQLSAQGEIMMQFSGPADDGEITEKAHDMFVKNGSHYFRTQQAIKDLVESTNKKITRMLPPHRVSHCGWFDHDWHAVIMTNR